MRTTLPRTRPIAPGQTKAEQPWWYSLRYPTRVPGKRTTNFTALFLITVALVAIGWTMVFSASAVYSYNTFKGDSLYLIKRQSASVVLGFIALQAALRFDYRNLPKFALPLVVSALSLNAMVPVVGVEVNGARRWLPLGPTTFQPSELSKIAIVIFASTFLSKRINKVHDDKNVTLPVLSIAAVLAGAVVIQPDLGTATVIALIALVMLYLAGTSLLTLASLGIGSFLIFLLFAIGAGYRSGRISAWLDPWEHQLGDGYQYLQAQVGLNAGGLDGVGLGQSVSKWGFLPEAHTDFIFAIICEEGGFLGALVVILLFTALVLFGVRTTFRAKDVLGMLLAGGITGWFGLQALINISIVAGLLPVSGMTLPFISYGGTSLLISMAAMGIVLNVARHERPTSMRRAQARAKDKRAKRRQTR